MADAKEFVPPVKQTRALQESVIGRIAEDNAQECLSQAEGRLEYAVDVVLSQDDAQIPRFPSKEEVLRDLNSKFENKTETRLFSCVTCDRYWWRRVPSRKPVSKCHRCQTKYDPIRREQEWGWCKFECEQCGHEFRGFGSMGNPSDSPCYQCGNQCFPVEVYPQNKRHKRNAQGSKSRNTHSCNAANCCNHAGGYNKGECSHPRSRAKKVLLASQQHVSTGSTVATFLSQGSLEAFDTDLSDIDEEV